MALQYGQFGGGRERPALLNEYVAGAQGEALSRAGAQVGSAAGRMEELVMRQREWDDKAALLDVQRRAIDLKERTLQDLQNPKNGYDPEEMEGVMGGVFKRFDLPKFHSVEAMNQANAWLEGAKMEALRSARGVGQNLSLSRYFKSRNALLDTLTASGRYEEARQVVNGDRGIGYTPEEADNAVFKIDLREADTEFQRLLANDPFTAMEEAERLGLVAKFEGRPDVVEQWRGEARRRQGVADYEVESRMLADDLNGKPWNGDDVKELFADRKVSADKAAELIAKMQVRDKRMQEARRKGMEYVGSPEAYRDAATAIALYDPGADPDRMGMTAISRKIADPRLSKAQKEDLKSWVESLGKEGEWNGRQKDLMAYATKAYHAMYSDGTLWQWRRKVQGEGVLPGNEKNVVVPEDRQKALAMEAQGVMEVRRFIQDHPEATLDDVRKYVDGRVGRLRLEGSGFNSSRLPAVQADSAPEWEAGDVRVPDSPDDEGDGADEVVEMSFPEPAEGVSLDEYKARCYAMNRIGYDPVAVDAFDRAVEARWTGALKAGLMALKGDGVPDAGAPLDVRFTDDVNALLPYASGGLMAYAQDFVDIGVREGVDPALLLAIAKHETGNGRSAAFRDRNNAMGVSPGGGGPRAFGSVQESVAYMARQLKRNYLDKGLVSIAQIGGKYAPVGAGNDPGGLNKDWVSGVTRFYDAIKRGV